MAIWRLHLVARETAGQDENGWPLTHFVNLSTDIEENSVFRLREEARTLVRQQVKAPTAIVGMERVDKRTGKNYHEWFHDSPEDLPIVLDEKQWQSLKDMKERIWSKALDGGELLSEYNCLDPVRYLSAGAACIYEDPWERRLQPTRIVPHGEAEVHIAALQKFYSSITPVELQVLCLPDNYLSAEQLNVIRSYSAQVGV